MRTLIVPSKQRVFSAGISARYSALTNNNTRCTTMPKKKFINGPAAKYALLPPPDESTGRSLRWIRTDVNTQFQQFHSVLHDTEGETQALNKDNSLEGANLRTERNTLEHTLTSILSCPDEEYCYERHLRLIGSDPNALYFQSKPRGELSQSVDEQQHNLQKGHRSVGAGDSSEVEAETSMSLTDVDSDFCADDYTDDYDSFFNGIIGSYGEFSDTNQATSGACMEQLKRADVDGRSPIETLPDDVFRRFLQRYDEDENEDSLRPIGVDRPVLDALSDLRLVMKTTGENMLKGKSNALTQIDREYSETTLAIEDTEVLRLRIDCETVLSSYSVSENHPRLLQVLAKKAAPQRETHRKHPAQSSAVNASSPYSLQCSCDSSIHTQGWRENTTRKGETYEEKKVRKAAVKEGRREARILKKSLKDAFKREGTQHDRLT